MLGAVPQKWTIGKGATDDGQPIAQLLIQWPKVSALLELDRNSGMKLADQLREIFGGLQIATDLPPPSSNGHAFP
jgi:hypothetical protein